MVLDTHFLRKIKDMNKKVIKYLNRFDLSDAKDKTILITGGNSGIGLYSAKYAAYIGMNVIIACRNKQRGEDAINQIKEEVPNAKIRLMILDQSEEASIKSFVDTIIKEKVDIDIFYHNAGVYRLPYQLKEGKELIVSTNFFGPYMLTSLLLPYFKSLNHEIKMIITSSIASNWSSNTVDMLKPNEKVSKMTRYANSKMLDAYLFDYLNKNDHSNIKYYLVHPGVSWTGLFIKTYKSKLFLFLVKAFMKLICNPTWKSALSFIRVVEPNNKAGAFYGPTHLFHARGYPKENKFLNKKLKYTNEIISKTQEITCFNL